MIAGLYRGSARTSARASDAGSWRISGIGVSPSPGTCGSGMAGQPLRIGEDADVAGEASGRGRHDTLVGGPAHEVERGEAGVRAREAARGKHVIGAGHVVTEGDGAA